MNLPLYSIHQLFTLLLYALDFARRCHLFKFYVSFQPVEPEIVFCTVSLYDQQSEG